MSPIEFKAPWSRLLKITTSTGITIFAVLLFLAATIGPHFDDVVRAVFVGVPIVGLIAGLASIVRGYAITQDEVLIRRLFGATRLPLATLQSVEGKADAMKSALPLFANRGFFAILGWYWSSAAGLFRAYATDPSRAIVLRYANRKIVITPHDPQQFIMRARTLMGTWAWKA